MGKEYKSYSRILSLKETKVDFKKVKISNSEDAYKYALNFYEYDINIYESLFLVLLNSANNTIGYVKISQGGVSGTYVDPKIIAKYAVETLARSVILIHNHPSGYLKQSEADKNITKVVKDTLSLFNTSVLDHLIITEKGFYSFCDEGIL